MQKRKLFFLVPLAAVFLFSFLVMWLWNHIIVDITTFKAVTYWQAMGLLLLCKILFGFRGPGGRGFGGHRNFKDRMKNMSEEEKQRLRSWCSRRNTDFEKADDLIK